jgi:hypothetical protein
MNAYLFIGLATLIILASVFVTALLVGLPRDRQEDHKPVAWDDTRVVNACDPQFCRVRLPRAWDGLPLDVAELLIAAMLDGYPARVERVGRCPKRVTVRVRAGSELEQQLAGSCGMFRATQTGEWIWEVN